MKVIGIVGSRRRDSDLDYKMVRKVFKSVYEIGDNICSGLCYKGADRFAIIIAKDFGVNSPLWFPADWDQYGKVAGFLRNTDIAKNSNVLIACVAPDRTGGTEDTIKKFKKFHGDSNLYIV